MKIVCCNCKKFTDLGKQTPKKKYCLPCWENMLSIMDVMSTVSGTQLLVNIVRQFYKPSGIELPELNITDK